MHPDTSPYYVLYYVLIPLYKEALNRQRRTLLHASAVAENDSALVISGWGGSGKSNSIISLLMKGGEYCGDDLVAVSDGGWLYPFPRSLNLFSYNFRAFPELRRHLSRRARLGMWGVEVLMSIGLRVSNSYHRQLTSVGKRLTQHMLSPDQLGYRVRTTPVKVGAIRILPESEQGDYADVAALTARLVANIRFEFAPIQALRTMYTYLVGSEVEALVHERDVEIISGFSRSVLGDSVTISREPEVV